MDFITLPCRKRTMVKLNYVSHVTNIEAETVFYWLLNQNEYSVDFLRTKDGLYVGIENLTCIFRRKKIQNLGRWLTCTKKHHRQLTEAEKKYIASVQQYKCNICKQQLTNTYEIDHIEQQAIRQNHSRLNLQALCPHCHRKKTYQDSIYGIAYLEEPPINEEEKNIFSNFYYKPSFNSNNS